MNWIGYIGCALPSGAWYFIAGIYVSVCVALIFARSWLLLLVLPVTWLIFRIANHENRKRNRYGRWDF